MISDKLSWSTLSTVYTCYVDYTMHIITRYTHVQCLAQRRGPKIDAWWLASPISIHRQSTVIKRTQSLQLSISAPPYRLHAEIDGYLTSLQSVDQAPLWGKAEWLRILWIICLTRMVELAIVHSIVHSLFTSLHGKRQAKL